MSPTERSTLKKDHEQPEPHPSLNGQEARYRELLDTIPDWVWEVDLDGRFTYSNAGVTQVLGYSPEQVVGCSAFEFLSPEDHDRIRGILGEAVEKRHGFKGVVHRMRHQDGTTRIIESSGSPVFDSESNLVGFRGIDRDVTQRVNAEEALADAEALYRSLVEESLVGVYVIQDGKFVYANPRLAEIYAFDAPGEMVGKSVDDLVAPGSREIVLENISKRLSGQPKSIRYSLEGVRKDGSIVNVEVYGSRTIYHGRPAVIGSLVDITERVKAEEIERRRRQALTTLVDSLPGYAFLKDADSVYVTANQTFAKAVGTTPDEIVGKTDYDLFPRDLAEKYRADDRRLVETAQPLHVGEEDMIEGDRRITVATRKVPLTDETGNVVGLIGLGFDVTERKQAEEAIRASEANYRAIFDAANDAIFVHDITNGAILDVNRKMTEMYGYTPEEVRELPVEALSAGTPPYTQEEAILWIRKAVEGEPQLFEWRAKDRSGRVFWVEVNLKRAVIGGQDRLLAVVRDVTARKHVEEALRRSEGNFRAIFNYAPALIITYDREAVVLEVNQAFERFSGFAKEQLVGRSMFETFANPEILAKKEDLIESVFSGNTIQDTEWEAVRPDGTKVYALANTTPAYDDEGNVSKALSMGVDITERKAAERYQREMDQHKRDFYRRTILAATEGKLVISEQAEIREIAGPPIKDWEIARGEDLGLIRHEVMEIAQSSGMDEARVYDLVLAVGEITTNAFKHAGSGQAFLSKRDDELVFMVSDHGPGIEAVTLPEVALTRGYSTAGTLGMGYKAVLSIVDRVYLATGPWGTTVAVEMSLHPVQKSHFIPDTWAAQR